MMLVLRVLLDTPLLLEPLALPSRVNAPHVLLDMQVPSPQLSVVVIYLDVLNAKKGLTPLRTLQAAVLVQLVRGLPLVPVFALLVLLLSLLAELLHRLWEVLKIAKFVLLVILGLTPVLFREFQAAARVLPVNTQRLMPKHALPALLVHTLVLLLVPAHLASLVNMPALLVPLLALTARKVILLLVLVKHSAILVQLAMSVPPLTDSLDAKSKAQLRVVSPMDLPTWVLLS